MERGNIKQGIALAFLGGYVDTLGFIALFGLFTAHVTGNFVLIGRALVEPAYDIIPKLLVFPVFIVFVAIARMLILHWERSSRPALRNSYLLQLVLLCAGLACGVLASPMANAHQPMSLLTGMLCAGAMATQNAYGKLLLGKAAATTVMTGNVTQLVIELTDALRGDGAALIRCKALARPVLAFAVGCILGAYGYLAFGFSGLLLPCLVLVGMAVVTRD
ncbi:hypothetical protein ASF61_05080 [Duganella sp. Leaf126]|uniref:YoaK family protein n=1 Tax=Duganella sp. Leaf126 TaxID=1736266 RepID=UPI0006F51133|nr:YoaK family protein [Duganella sp. Leaf126]KQQ40159.1 hypothetical protein ASF61_05080 [Duganella sp. Leaf126]